MNPQPFLDSISDSIGQTTDRHEKLMHLSRILNKPISYELSGFAVELERPLIKDIVDIIAIHYNANTLGIHCYRVKGTDYIEDIDLFGFDKITTLETDVEFILSYLEGKGVSIE